ncbi:UNVERIFIED_CONTAM: hypothetical protein Slati_1165200 [Sesamum latifolium]|uniref:Uncharacterized protein n=1 Tax=Sesamum latifolium TaxID=2727402 RepID=A0AAW2XI17_9LAMI
MAGNLLNVRPPYCFSEGHALSFTFGGSSNLVLDVLETFLKTLEMDKPLWRNLLRSQRGSSLPPVH